ncbi:MAG: 30S ribosomal protein S17 [archaeon]|mgnify:CR=1 FL=1|jgi:small subunit ribosomal protein S17|nr:30S ribosomal protein S17 [Euryarchaeota archaeon]MDP7260787.1 30S ribosomal protein S17 [archaeon]HIK01402.1 30S ribosomal protein S17 [Candidatus Undinarchaeales archaeon ERR594346 U_76725]|tara:strand:+ start:27660 stop:28007 length:348 start_codon:yes stop_codon:yes gene_type:complete
MVKKEEKSKTAPKAAEKKSTAPAEPEITSLNFSTKGHPFRAIVVSDKMKNSAVVVRHFVRKITKFERYEKRTTRLTVHNPESISAKTGDEVIVQSCRPISKTKSHTIISVLSRSE